MSQEKYGMHNMDNVPSMGSNMSSLNPLSSQPKPGIVNRNSTIVTEPQNKTLVNVSGAQSMNLNQFMNASQI